MFAEIKKHPYLIGGVIVGIIVLFFLSSSGSTSTAVDDSGSDASAAQGISDAQANATAQVQLGGLALQANQQQTDAAVTVATLQAHTADNANTLAAGVASQQINASLDAQNTANTLQAQTTQAQIKSNTDMLSISTNGQIQQTQILTNALVAEASIAAGVQNNMISANKDIQTQSWVDKIFG